MKKIYRFPFPALNVKRRSESVATDTLCCDKPAIDDGSKCAQVFLYTKIPLTDAHGMEYDKKFVNSSEDKIR